MIGQGKNEKKKNELRTAWFYLTTYFKQTL